MSTKVVNIHRREPYDIYIGRPSRWGNPFPLSDFPSREACLERFKSWLLSSIHGKLLLADLEQLRGKRLGCFCAPDLCHGDIYIQLLESKGGGHS